MWIHSANRIKAALLIFVVGTILSSYFPPHCVFSEDAYITLSCEWPQTLNCFVVLCTAPFWWHTDKQSVTQIKTPLSQVWVFFVHITTFLVTKTYFLENSFKGEDFILFVLFCSVLFLLCVQKSSCFFFLLGSFVWYHLLCAMFVYAAIPPPQLRNDKHNQNAAGFILYSRTFYIFWLMRIYSPTI